MTGDFEAHSIIASHQASTSFLDVTIPPAVEEQGGAGTVTQYLFISHRRDGKKTGLNQVLCPCGENVFISEAINQTAK